MKPRTFFFAFGLFIVVGLPRLFALDAHWSSDETLWLGRSAQFMSVVQARDFEQTLIVHHPGVMTMWLAGLRRLFGNTDLWLSQKNLALARWFICVAVSTGLVAAFFLLLRLFGLERASAAWAFLAVDPFFLAQTRRVHTDALATLFILLTVLSFLLFCSIPTAKPRQRHRYLVFAGVAFGFACLSKSYSLILLPWMSVCLLIFRPNHTPWHECLYNAVTTWIFFLNWSLLTVLGGWPIFWHPVGLLFAACLLGTTLFLQRAMQTSRYPNFSLGIATFVLIASSIYATKTVWLVLDKVGWALTTAHEVDHFFLGNIVADPGGLFYLFTLSIKSTPFVLPLAIGAILFLSKRQPQDTSQHFKIATTLGVVAILFIFCLSLTSKKFPRYLLPAFPMLDILAGLGLFNTVKWIGARFKNSHSRKVAYIACVTLVLLLTTVPIFTLHPYYGTYYNLCWKVADLTKIITVGEASGLDLAAKYLNKKQNAELMSVQVSDLGAEFFRYYFVGTVYRADKNRVEGTEQLRHADYEVVYIRDLQIGRVPQTGTRNGELEYVITLNGIDLVWIYRIPQAEN